MDLSRGVLHDPEASQYPEPPLLHSTLPSKMEPMNQEVSKGRKKAGRGCAAGIGRSAHSVLGTLEALQVDHWFGQELRFQS